MFCHIIDKPRPGLIHFKYARLSGRGWGGGGDCSFKQPEDGINSPLRTRARSGDAQAHDVRDLATIACQPRIKTNWNFQHIHMNQPIFFQFGSEE